MSMLEQLQEIRTGLADLYLKNTGNKSCEELAKEIAEKIAKSQI